MSEIKWIKLSTTMFDNDNIKLIEALPDKDSILIIWIKLLAQAGKCNASGYLLLNDKIPYTDEMLATIFNRPLNTVRLALRTFKNFGMIDMENDLLKVSEWEDTQNIEGMEKIKEQNRVRQQIRRNKLKEMKLLENKNNNTIGNKRFDTSSRDGHVTSHQNHAIDIDIDIDIEKEIDKDIYSNPNNPKKGKNCPSDGSQLSVNEKEVEDKSSQNISINNINNINNNFEELWKLYPIKEGKGNVKAKKKKELYKIGYDKMKLAIERYLKNTDLRRINFPDLNYKNGSTFFNSGYVDFIDDNFEFYKPKENTKFNQPIQSTNYEQREYSDDYWDKFIKNKDTAL